MSRLFAEAERLEELLGDAHNRVNPFGFNAACAGSAAASFPEVFRRFVVEHADLHLAFVPAEAGGTDASFYQTMMRVRVCARRDVAVMPATMFSITAMTCLLLSGSEEQIGEGVAILRRGGAIGFALSEPDHGGDVLSSECVMVRAGSGWALTGEKWMVGLGTRSEAIYLVARSGGRGPAAFSGVLLEGDALRGARAGETVSSGMRGIDFARLSLQGVQVAVESVVGEIGKGLEAAIRALQVVRVVGTSANVACNDTLLRTVFEHVGHRTIGGQSILRQARVEQDLGVALAFHVAADIAVLFASRALHVVPEAQAPLSAIVKRIACEGTAEVIARCSDVLGTRSVVHDGVGELFIKVKQDAEVLRYVDTGPEATRRTLSTHVTTLLKAGDPVECGLRVDALTDLAATLPAWEPKKMRLASRSPSDVLVAFDDRRSSLGAALPPKLAHLVDDVADEIEQVRTVAAQPNGSPVEVADRLAAVHTAALCLLFWHGNRDRDLYGCEPGDSTWLAAAVGVCLSMSRGARPHLGRDDAAAVVAMGADLVRRHCLLTAATVRLGGRSRFDQGDL